ncbi:PH domain-containing protein [Haloterrigena salifodinae]|uniref:PH domain-containing protein n=1 Tax=Haloterrigena salifodinae TaxID=2675099 RepID=UPI000F87722D|nr:PH domain-containing protein [Haloterrigena salifodinae]
MELAKRSIIRRVIDDITWSFITLPVFVLAFIGIGEASFILTYILSLLMYYGSRVIAQFLYWQRSSYSIEDGQITMRRGVLNLKRRSVPLERVQQVDVVQDWFNSLLGLTAVTFETAGTREKSGIELQYVTKNDAERIQKRLENQTEWSVEATAEQTTLYDASLQALILRGLTSLHLKYIFIGILGIATILTDLISTPGNRIPILSKLVYLPLPVVLGGLLLLVWLFGAIKTVIKFYDLSVTLEGDNLRSRAGFIYDHSTTIPMENIQVVRISSNCLQRILDYAVLTVSSAGMTEDNPFPFRKPLIPLEKSNTIETVAQQILPYRDESLQGPPKRMRRRYLLHYLIGIGILTVISIAGSYQLIGTIRPLGAWPLLFALAGPVLAHLNWKSRGIEIYGDQLVLKRGVVRQHTYIVPLNRIQEVSVTQSVFQRRANLATISIKTASPVLSIGIHAADFDIQTAESIQHEIRNISGTAPRETQTSK